ncbi:MAG TPA: chemotaxis protein CheC [Allocoleopsis sp.]
MLLNEDQKDALKELINIGFSRTASSLSELTGSRVILQVPDVSIFPIEKLVSELSNLITGEVATVQQIFSGSVSGNALLLLNYEGALMLTQLLDPETSSSQAKLQESSAEILTEVGNILLNACLSVFGNLLQMQVYFSVPRLHLEALNGLLNSLVIGKDKDELRYALVVSTSFCLRDNSVQGYLVIILGVSSLDSLITAVDHWASSASLDV